MKINLHLIGSLLPPCVGSPNSWGGRGGGGGDINIGYEGILENNIPGLFRNFSRGVDISNIITGEGTGTVFRDTHSAPQGVFIRPAESGVNYTGGRFPMLGWTGI